MNKMQKMLLLVGLGSALGGCSAMPGNSEYACQGMPDGATCISAREAYERTNDPNTYKRTPPDMQRPTPSQEEGKPVAVPPVIAGEGGAPQPFIQDGRVPVRTPAYVMRIWVSTWEDRKGDLHMPGFIYTEVEPRRWQVGLPTSSTSGSALRPLDAPPPSAGVSSNTKPAPASGAKKQQ